MDKTKLSIYLVKDMFESTDQIFQLQTSILYRYSNEKVAYFVGSNINTPKWLHTFFTREDANIIIANSKVVLLVKRTIDNERRIFALTFGYGKSLFADDVLEERFGLKVLLNSTSDDSLRKISLVNIGGNYRQSQSQIPNTGSISEFGFDVERDLIRSVSAKTTDRQFGKSVAAGSDIFAVSVAYNVDNIEEFLDYCYTKYKSDRYKEHFEWIDNIAEIRSKSIVDRLNNELVELLIEQAYDKVWSAVPEIISWVEFDHFRYNGNRYDDINIGDIYNWLHDDNAINIDALKQRQIHYVSPDGIDINHWTIFKCLIAEFSIGGKQYCLCNGKWYKISDDYASKINTEYANIPLSQIDTIDYSPDGRVDYGETQYNAELAAHLPHSIYLHEIGEIPYGGGSGNKIEVCDILTENHELLHIKKNSGSSTLSHLFNQGAVSGELLLDSAFRQKANDKLRALGRTECFNEDFLSRDYTVVFGIINKSPDDRPKIPFFSKVAIRYAYQRLRGIGYTVQIKNIFSTHRL
jgi:uncharacterized protein (TIGR04141 family)